MNNTTAGGIRVNTKTKYSKNQHFLRKSPYQGVKIVSFSENIACITKWMLPRIPK